MLQSFILTVVDVCKICEANFRVLVSFKHRVDCLGQFGIVLQVNTASVDDPQPLSSEEIAPLYQALNSWVERLDMESNAPWKKSMEKAREILILALKPQDFVA